VKAKPTSVTQSAISARPSWSLHRDPLSRAPPRSPPGGEMRQSNIPFRLVCKGLGLPAPAEEYRFHGTRKWRFDFAWPSHKLALEVEGGTFVGGRHTRGSGFAKDLEKYNTAAAMGWRLIRVVPRELESPQTIDWIKACLTS
jgi:hypothetical protein